MLILKYMNLYKKTKESTNEPHGKNPPWRANSFSNNQKMFHVLSKLKIHYSLSIDTLFSLTWSR